MQEDRRPTPPPSYTLPSMRKQGVRYDGSGGREVTGECKNGKPVFYQKPLEKPLPLQLFYSVGDNFLPRRVRFIGVAPKQKTGADSALRLAESFVLSIGRFFPETTARFPSELVLIRHTAPLPDIAVLFTRTPEILA